MGALPGCAGVTNVAWMREASDTDGAEELAFPNSEPWLAGHERRACLWKLEPAIMAADSNRKPGST